MSSNDKTANSELLREPDSHRAYYEELGRALSTWAHLENTLSKTFGDACRPSNPIVANSAFWAAVSFEAKKDLCDKAVSSAVIQYPELLSEWNNLRERLTRKSKTRNKFAHGTVVTVSWSKNGKNKSETFLAPYYYSQIVERKAMKLKKTDPRPKNRVPLKNIVSAHKEFAELERNLWEFSERMFDVLEKADRASGSSVMHLRTARFDISKIQKLEGN